jgi:hypothetical protein
MPPTSSAPSTDEQRPVVGHRRPEVGVAERRHVEPADDEGDQPEGVGHRRPRALGQATAQRHTQPRADQDRRHVEDGPGAAQHSSPWLSIT